MRFVSIPSAVFVVLPLLFLTACAQSLTRSVLEIDNSYLTETNRGILERTIYGKAQTYGADCGLVVAERFLHACNFPASNPSVRLLSGFSKEGVYRVSIESTHGHFIPPSDRAVTSGKFVSETVVELEAWMLTLVPDEVQLSSVRSYLGRGVSVPIEQNVRR